GHQRGSAADHRRRDAAGARGIRAFRRLREGADRPPVAGLSAVPRPRSAAWPGAVAEAGCQLGRAEGRTLRIPGPPRTSFALFGGPVVILVLLAAFGIGAAAL